MTTEGRKILTMLAEQKISVAEAEGLLDALESMPEPPPKLEVKYITNHPPLLKTLEQARKVARSNVPILIIGESGTGKELVARFIHQSSPRRDSPMVSVNCTVLSESLAESELFGHERGAFTGAHQAKRGTIEVANGGTIFFDEIDQLSSNLQLKLNQFLHTGELSRLGGHQKILSDVRAIAGSHLPKQELESRLQRGLYERLSLFTLELTPLRERKDDIPQLVEHFFKEHADKHNRPIPTLTSETMDALMAHDWPGNVRELARAIERAVVLCDGEIGVENLPKELIETA